MERNPFARDEQDPRYDRAAWDAYLARERLRPAPENTNPKVFQCVSDYIDNRKTSTDTVSQINKLVNDGELIDGYGAPLGGSKRTPLMDAIIFKAIDIEVVQALLDNGANVNI